ncbi:MAG: OmpA family protein [Alphaproteobacteria bacterium]
MKKQILALVLGTALLSGCSYLCEECQDGSCEAPKKVIFTSVPTLFAFDSANLNTADKASLDKAVQQIKAENPAKVVVNGYADSTGPAEYNVALSQKRADAVADYLVKEGVCPKSITAKGYGSTTAFDAQTTVAGRAQNRRVEIVID